MSGAVWTTPLRHAVLELTNRCNLRCPHCGSDSGVARPGELDEGAWLRVVDELAELGCEEVTLLGGEVFLAPSWETVARRIRERGLRLVVITNGLLLDESLLERFLAVEPFLVGVSVDGPDPERYRATRGVDGFDRAMRVLRGLVEGGVPHVNAVTTFTRPTLAWWDDFAGRFDGEPFAWQVQLANKGGERFDDELFVGPEDYARWVAAARRTLDERPGLRIRFMDDFGYQPLDPGLRFLHQTWHGCLAGRSLVGIRSDGRVAPCLSLGAAFMEADLRDESLTSIWRSGRWFGRFRDRVLTGGCLACDERERCGGGCAAMAVSATGSLGDNPCCIRRIETARLAETVWGDA